MAYWGAERAPGLVSRLIWGDGTQRGHVGEARYLSGSTERVPEEELKQQQNRNRKSEEGLQRGGEGKQSGLGMARILMAHTVACCPCLGDTLTHAPLPVLQGTHCGGWGREKGEPQPWSPQPPTSGKRRFEGALCQGAPGSAGSRATMAARRVSHQDQSQL